VSCWRTWRTPSNNLCLTYWHVSKTLCAFLHLFAAGDEALRRELLAYMADHPAVARYAAPDDVVFVPEIPHNATGALL
jgi:acyl-coenzyme A synthetase/AMP-(fatty) acid ligase